LFYAPPVLPNSHSNPIPLIIFSYLAAVFNSLRTGSSAILPLIFSLSPKTILSCGFLLRLMLHR
jgi:hypothetical protein